MNKLLVFWQLSKFKMTRFNLLSVAFGYFYVLPYVPYSTLDWLQFGYLMLGTIFLCTSCFTLNQVLEVKQDTLMKRTQKRPLPQKQITIRSAWVYGLICGMIGLSILWFKVSNASFVIGFIILISYVFIYTPLKRVTTLNTLIGGIPGSLPPFLGWFAVSSRVSLDGLVIFFLIFFWQIAHFLALNWKYRDDYAKAKLVMLSSKDHSGILLFRQIIVQSCLLLIISVFPYLLGTAHWTYLIVALLLGFLFLNKAVLLYIRRTDKAASSVFLFSLIYLPVILFFLVNPFFS